jgi:endonuclease/exonuclease/phosphatase family metal-dependent hydrolase
MPPDPTRVVRVASYNLHRCVGSDRTCDPARVARLLGELDCELVGLQEVDNSPGELPTSMQLDYLAQATGMTSVAGIRILRHLGHYGNALLTRGRVRAVRRHDLSYARREPRGVLDVEVELAGVDCRIFVTHLGLGPRERRHQMRKVLALVAETPVEEPLLLLGDLNEWLPFRAPLRWLHALFGRPPAVRSFPASLPLFALDRIWARPRGSLLAVRAHASPLARTASDHLPVVGEWAIRGEASPRSGVEVVP